jgi:hypothetical protein
MIHSPEDSLEILETGYGRIPCRTEWRFSPGAPPRNNEVVLDSNAFGLWPHEAPG